MVMSDDAVNKQAPAVMGNMTNEEALAKILHDSGRTYQKIDANTVAIKPTDAAPAGQLLQHRFAGDPIKDIAVMKRVAVVIKDGVRYQ
jgi:hypothetical protein